MDTEFYKRLLDQIPGATEALGLGAPSGTDQAHLFATMPAKAPLAIAPAMAAKTSPPAVDPR